MKPAARSKKGRGVFCNLPLLLLIGAIQFLVIYSPAIDRYMVMITKGTRAMSFDHHALRFLREELAAFAF
jgi:hypothetical protein